VIYPLLSVAYSAGAGQLDRRGEVVTMTTEAQVKKLMDEIVAIIRYNSFVPEYQEQATLEECVGIAIAKYFAWDSRIFIAFYHALEDANFHTAAAEVEALAERVNTRYSKSTFTKAA